MFHLHWWQQRQGDIKNCEACCTGELGLKVMYSSIPLYHETLSQAGVVLNVRVPLTKECSQLRALSKMNDEEAYSCTCNECGRASTSPQISSTV